MTHVPEDVVRSISLFSPVPVFSGVNREGRRIESELDSIRRNIVDYKYPNWNQVPYEAILYAISESDIASVQYMIYTSMIDMDKLRTMFRNDINPEGVNLDMLLFLERNGFAVYPMNMVRAAILEDRINDINYPNDYMYLIASHRNDEALDLWNKDAAVDMWIITAIETDNITLLNALADRYEFFFDELPSAVANLSKPPSPEMQRLLHPSVDFRTVEVQSQNPEMLRWATDIGATISDPDIDLRISPGTVDFYVDNSIDINWPNLLYDLMVHTWYLDTIRRILERVPNVDRTRAMKLVEPMGFNQDTILTVVLTR